MKVDVINTRYGDIEVEYSTFTKGFFVKKYPEKMEQINGLRLLKNRDNSFKDFQSLESYIRDLVHNSMLDFEFERKVIIYRINAPTWDYDNSLSFEYLVCDESKKTQKYQGKESQLREYFVHESNLKKYTGKRDILGQILSSSRDSFTIIDYDEKVHLFFKEFTINFHFLKESLVRFFDKDKIIINVHQNQNNIQLLLPPTSNIKN